MQLEEARLARIIQHINSDYEICFISACRGNRSNNKNKELTSELARDITKLGYGFIQITGGYTETYGDGSKEDVTEASFFVINTDKDIGYKNDFAAEMLALGRKYEQQDILLKTKLLPTAWYDCNSEARSSSIYTKFTTHDIESGFSKIHGQKFSLIEMNEDQVNNNKRVGNFPRQCMAIQLRKSLGLKEICNVTDIDSPNFTAHPGWNRKAKEEFIKYRKNKGLPYK